jgi:hypothetical protein
MQDRIPNYLNKEKRRFLSSLNQVAEENINSVQTTCGGELSTLSINIQGKLQLSEWRIWGRI